MYITVCAPVHQGSSRVSSLAVNPGQEGGGHKGGQEGRQNEQEKRPRGPAGQGEQHQTHISSNENQTSL